MQTDLKATTPALRANPRVRTFSDVKADIKAGRGPAPRSLESQIAGFHNVCRDVIAKAERDCPGGRSMPAQVQGMLGACTVHLKPQ